MAIDTETKRRSVVGASFFVAKILPVADGTIDAPDRAHVSGFFSRAYTGVISSSYFDKIMIPILRFLRTR